jgi:hypothetical protein
MRESPFSKVQRENLEGIARECEPALDARQRERLQQWRDRLDGGRFHLALLGEFKRGKSTLGNALLGTEVFPASVVPTTALATFARYSPRPRARIRLRSGASSKIELSELAGYVCEQKRSEKTRRIRFVEAFVPSPFLRDTDLLDTPGIGSSHRHNTETALAALGEVDAAIVVLAADQPVSQTELDFLEELRPRVSRFFFVVNRADLLSAEELGESLAFIRKTLTSRQFTTSDVYAVSARRELSGAGGPEFSRFRESLARFLRDEKEAAWLGSMRRRLTALLSERLFELKIVQESSRCDAAERERRSVALRASFEGLAARRTARAAVAQDQLRRLLDAYDDAFGRFQAQAVATLDGAIDSQAGALAEASGRELDRALRAAVLAQGEIALGGFRDSAERLFRAGLERIDEDVRRASEALVAEAYQTAGRLFHMPPPAREEAERAPELAGLDFEIQDIRCSLEEAADFTVFHLPRPVARRALVRRARGSARDLLNRNGGRIRHQLLTLGEQFLRRILARADAFEIGLAETLLEAIRRGPAPAAPDPRESIRRLDGAVARLEAA